MIKFEVNSKSVVDALNKYSRISSRENVRALKKSLQNITLDAKRNHRFITRTGNLERSVKFRVINKESGQVYIDNGTAPYGKFIHDGFKSWAPDPFLEAAVMRRGKVIVKDNLIDAIRRTVDKVGLAIKKVFG